MSTSAHHRSRPDAEAISLRAAECLSDADILAFAEGQLEPQNLPAFHGHLDQCEACQQLVMEAVRACGSALTHPGDAEPGREWNTMFRRGALIGGRYLIQRFIARGGMGEVYEAFDRDLMERVALKTVTSTACDSQNAVRRLKAEVQLARRVSHPNVCRIYDLGTHTLDTGVQIHFLTMEFVEGETLGQRLRLGGALLPEEAKEIARQLLRGLSAAHAAGILHRDFKSDNVMLRPEEDGTSTPLILDFGLARALDDTLNHGLSGSSRHVVGTFGYMAPEQLHGRPLTVASDLYSFGIVCFEMLKAELPAPNLTDVDLPPPFAALVTKCLKSAPAERFESTEEALACLETVERPGLRALRRRLPGLGAVIALLAIAGFGIAKLPEAAKGLSRASDSQAQPWKAAVAAAMPHATSKPEPSIAPVPPPAASSAEPGNRAAPRAPARKAAGISGGVGTAPKSSSPAPPERPTALSPPTPENIAAPPAPSATIAVPPTPAATAPAPSANAPSSKAKKFGWENPFYKDQPSPDD